MDKKRLFQKYRLYLFVLLGLLTTWLMTGLGMSLVIKNKLSEAIANTKDYTISVESISVGFFGNKIILDQVKIIKTKTPLKFRLFLKEVLFYDPNLMELYVNGNFEFGKAQFSNASLNLNGEKLNQVFTSKSQIKKTIRFCKLEILNSKVSIGDEQNENDWHEASIENLSLSNLVYDGHQWNINKDIKPLDNLSLNNVEINLGAYEKMQVKKIIYSDGNLSFKQFKIAAKYSRAELSKRLKQERDHIMFTARTMTIVNPNYQNEHQFILVMDEIDITEYDLDIYRDKTLSDNQSFKEFYPKKLKTLPFKINIGQIQLKKGRLSYTEKTTENRKPEELVFNDIEALISNLGNNNNKTIECKITSKIMDNGTMELRYNTALSNTDEHFLVQGKIFNFNTSAINPFLMTSLQSKAQGQIEEMYFSVDGTRSRSTTDIKIKYENFKFKVLQKDLLKINKVLTFLGNLIVNDGTQSDEKGYRYGYSNTEPDSSKSLINYIWVSVKGGLLDAITGKGEQK